jgi:hypothetical protein
MSARLRPNEVSQVRRFSDFQVLQTCRSDLFSNALQVRFGLARSRTHDRIEAGGHAAEGALRFGMATGRHRIASENRARDLPLRRH